MSIVFSRREEFALIRLDRPAALNALNFAMLAELGAAFDRAAADGARCLLVTGAGERAFCAGADIAELANRSLLECRRGAALGQAIFAKLDQLALPSVAILNGFAFGGGLELALACTFRLAVPQAKLGLPEIKLGLIPGYGGTQRLPRVVGPARALEMILSGRTIEAEEAERIGLINGIIRDDPVAEAMAFARRFTGHGLLALGLAREAVARALDTPLAQGLKIECDLATLAFQTEDAAEGMAAFCEKRPPRFQDR